MKLGKIEGAKFQLLQKHLILVCWLLKLALVSQNEGGNKEEWFEMIKSIGVTS
jgi:hypothetical protein